MKELLLAIEAQIAELRNAYDLDLKSAYASGSLDAQKAAEEKFGDKIYSEIELNVKVFEKLAEIKSEILAKYVESIASESSSELNFKEFLK